MKKVHLAVIALALALSFLLTACAKPANVVPSASPATATPKATGAYPLTFDNYGRKVVVSAKPRKVLTLGPNCTELFVALGLTDYIVGNSLKNHSRGPLAGIRRGVQKDT